MPTDVTNNAYAQAKKNLNPEQKSAVETIDGPVMVFAGPGTGKTQILALRIAEILTKTDTSARSILALTFTESGVAAMRERLVNLIGGAAYDVAIYTFHGFANRVINESGAEFYKSRSLEPIDDITQLNVIISLLDELNLEAIRPTRAPYFYVKPIMSAIKHLKNEGITPTQLEELCAQEIKNIEADPTSFVSRGATKGKLKQTTKVEIDKLQQTVAVSKIYAAYESVLSERGFYDYEDMILFLVNRFTQSGDLKAHYQEQFQYLLIDEYQDTNNAQNQLLRLLSDYFDNPNLFVVGDDKQSIYRFQGASSANLLNFLDWYPETKIISLEENYRSGQPILSGATSLIGRNASNLVDKIPKLNMELHCQHDKGAISLARYATPDRETEGIVRKIQQLLKNNVSPDEIAIIYRNNHEAETFTHLLSRLQIPFVVESSNDALTDGDVRCLLNLLLLATNPDDDYAFFRLMHASFSEVDTRDVIIFGRLRREKRMTSGQMIDQAIEEAKALHSWSSIYELRQKVIGWYRYQSQHNLTDIVEHIFFTSGLLGAMLQQSDSQARLSRMRRFFDEVKRIASRTIGATLEDLFSEIAIRQEYRLPLVCPPTVETNQSVRLMTAHKSKGLEFAYVFIPHCTDSVWGGNKKKQPLLFPSGIIPHHHTAADAMLEEERRLFYVALTRAKQEVILSLSELDTDQKKCLPSQFLNEIDEVMENTPEPSGEFLAVTYFRPVQERFLQAMEDSVLRQQLIEQAITPTGLNTFLNCPQEYLYRDVYHIPGAREAFQSFGTAMHKSMELWGNWSRDSAIIFDLPRILTVFSDALRREGLTQDELDRYLKLGTKVLTQYWQSKGGAWIAPLATEYSFTPHKVMLDSSIPITGKLDKIEAIPKSKFVRVIDYKTGRVKSRGEIEGKTASGDLDYKRQLVFYTVLAEADPAFPYTVGEAALSFLDDDCRFTTEIFEITKQEKEELKDLIRHIYHEISALHFDHTTHKVRWGRGESLCDILRGDLALEFNIAKAKTIQESLGI